MQLSLYASLQLTQNDLGPSPKFFWFCSMYKR